MSGMFLHMTGENNTFLATTGVDQERTCIDVFEITCSRSTR